MHTTIVEATLSFIEHHRHSAALVVFLLAFSEFLCLPVSRGSGNGNFSAPAACPLQPVSTTG